MAQPVSQYNFRIRNDNGGESSSGATWVANTNINASLLTDKTYRIRFGLYSSSTSTAFTPTLYYSYDGGTYTAVTASSSYVRASSGTCADGTATTQQITSGGFISSVVEANDGVCPQITIQSSYYSEVEFTFKILSANCAAGKLINLRVYGTTITYNQTPSITVILAYSGSGTMATGGTAGNAATYSYSGSGLLSTGGTASLSASYLLSGSGSIATDGESLIRVGYYNLFGQGRNDLFGSCLSRYSRRPFERWKSEIKVGTRWNGKLEAEAINN